MAELAVPSARDLSLVVHSSIWGMEMRIVDLTEEHEQLYFACLEDWSKEIVEGGNHKELWYRKMKDRGLRVKLALDDKDVVGGMIQYVPIEHSPAEGRDLYFVNCIWVHGYKDGRGNFQRQGMGKALLKAAEDDVRDLGRKGIVAWGISLPFWMRAKWFKKQGFVEVDNDGGTVLMWKPFTDDAERPRWIRALKKPINVAGKVTVTSFVNGWCPGQNMVCERAKRAAGEFGGNVVFREISTFDRNVLKEYGIPDGLFIDEKQIRTGPPPSYEKIRKLIAKRVKKLRS